MIKRIILILLLLAVAGVGGKVIYDQWQIKMEQQLAQQEIQRQMVPIQQEKRQLMDELQQLQKQYDGIMNETATIQFVFSGLDERLYLEVFPAMLQYGMKGIMALSPTEYPGAPGRITTRQFQEMLRDGWSYCLQWDGTSVLWDAFTAVQWMMPENTIEMPDTVYLAPGVYSKQLDETLTAQGVRMVVHHGEDGLPTDITDVEGSLWHIGSVVWSADQARLDFQQNLNNRGNLAFDISFDSSYGSYSTLGFKDLLYMTTTAQTEKTLDVVDFSDVKQLYAYNNDVNGQENYRWLRKDEISAKIDGIHQRMAELDEKIAKISRGEKIDEETEPEETQEETAESPLTALENERMNIRMQIEKLEKEHPYQLVGRATAEFVFLSPKASVFTEIFPQLQSGQAKAVVAFTVDELPGTEGNMSWDQINDLIAHGWETCFAVKETGNWDEEIEAVQKACEAHGLKALEVAYIPQGLYTDALREKAEKAGFLVIIHHGEEALELADYLPEEGIWTAGCVNWTAESKPAVLTPVVEAYKNLVIAVSVDYDAYPFMASGMNTLLEETAKFVDEGRLLYTNFTEAMESQKESAIARDKVNEDRDRQMADLENQLAGIDIRIEEVLTNINNSDVTKTQTTDESELR